MTLFIWPVAPLSIFSFAKTDAPLKGRFDMAVPRLLGQSTNGTKSADSSSVYPRSKVNPRIYLFNTPVSRSTINIYGSLDFAKIFLRSNLN